MPSNKPQSKIKNSLIAIGALSLLAGVQPAQAGMTTYNVTQTYDQVVYNGGNMMHGTHPDWDTVFTGSFNYDPDLSFDLRVSNLHGSLSQAMTGNTTFRQLGYQLSTVYDAALGGLLITSFYQNTTDTFSNSGGVNGVTGFATGGTKSFGNQNAFATIFVNLADPTASLTQDQINKLAYGDCTTGSLMGMMNMCMTGWVKVTNGIPGPGGTMQGTFPIIQTITAVPEPETYAMLMAGLGLVGFISRRRKAS